MATLPAWKKAYGVLKDSTKVGLAHVNSDYKDLDVAIVKATNHVERPPKDRHLRKILIATSAVRPRADVGYCIHTLARRLAKTRNWTVALKTLIVIHRTLREGDPTFKEEILNFSLRGHILQLSNFKDDSSPIAWDCSAWVRTYALFIEERLECFRILKYDVETQNLPKAGQGHENGYSRTRELSTDELLEQLPALQRLLFRLVGCRPEGAAIGNFVIQYALALVLKESFKIYCAINDGIINLIDKFFEMTKHEAIASLEIYRRAGQQAISLSGFYEVCKGLELARNFQFPNLREPPQSFLATMEEYISDAPRIVSVPREQLEYPERLQLTYKTEEDVAAEDDVTQVCSDDHVTLPDSVATSITETPQNVDGAVDFLGLSVSAPDASIIDERNALALAIVPTDVATSSGSTADRADFDPSGWELTLVTTPSTNLSSANERELAGGLDTLTLNSLYDEGAYRAAQKPAYGVPAPNPFETLDPGIALPPAFQMTPAAYPSTNPFTPFSIQPPPTFQSTFPHQQPDGQLLLMAPSNPFADDAFGRFPENNNLTHGQTNNPFGSVAALL